MASGIKLLKETVADRIRQMVDSVACGQAVERAHLRSGRSSATRIRLESGPVVEPATATVGDSGCRGGLGNRAFVMNGERFPLSAS